jgi:hypothetical protein
MISIRRWIIVRSSCNPVVLPGAGVRIGAQQGRPPDLTEPGLGPQDRGPQLGSQIGPSEDMFEVYLGGIDHPWTRRRSGGLAPRTH